MPPIAPLVSVLTYNIALLDFSTPNGLRLNFSSLSSPNFATSYTLSSIGQVDGSLSYLYTSLPLPFLPSKSSTIPLRSLISGYRQVLPLRRPDEPWCWELWHQGKRIDKKDTLLYGSLYLPNSHLEALYLRRLSPVTQLKISCVSSSALKSGGSILFLLQRDVGKYSTEYLYSTDSALLGVRGLYNFGPDARTDVSSMGSETATEALRRKAEDVFSTAGTKETSTTVGLNGRFSAGAELYYGLLNKSGGMSTGIRFTTLPSHTGFPYTMTLTLNPLMGNLSSTYAVKAGQSLALCSRFDFNFYSYESELQVGMELWRRRNQTQTVENLEWVRRKLVERKDQGWGMPTSISELSSEIKGLGEEVKELRDEYSDENTAGVLKARMTHEGTIGLLWEGRVKELLYSCGVIVDFKRREQIFRGVGLEIMYSS